MLYSRITPLISLFIFLLGSSHYIAADNNQFVVDPAISEHFKQRDNREQFQKIRNKLVEQIQETQKLLPQVEEELIEGKPFWQVFSSTNAEERLQNHITELEQAKESLEEIKVTTKGNETEERLKSSIDTRLENLKEQLEDIDNSWTENGRREAVEALKVDLKEYAKIPEIREEGWKTPKSPGWSIAPAPPKVNQPPKAGIVYIEPQRNLNSTQSNNTHIANNPDDAQKENNKKASLAASALEKLSTLVIPKAYAQEYVQPLVNDGTQSCYADIDDYNNNINKDLDLTQPELEVDPSLDSEAYARITELAAELEYSPVKILEYVTNNTKLEYYRSSVKGAIGTLDSGAGNPVDHASLLVALLRASGIPARYVHAYIYVQDKQEHIDWWNVKDFDAVKKVAIETAKYYTTADEYIETIDGVNAFPMGHVHVEACVPYSNYRASAGATEGYRWVPLDASFKRYDVTEGITNTAEFNYDEFLSGVTRKLQHEVFAAQSLEYARSVNPNYNLDDIGTRWIQKPIKLEFLPDTLPYHVKFYPNWNSALTPSKVAVLPDDWRAMANLTLDSNATFEIPMTQLAKKRLTLSFEGVGSQDQTLYQEFLDGTRTLDCTNNNLNLKPVFRLEGEEILNLNLQDLTLCNEGKYTSIDIKASVSAWQNLSYLDFYEMTIKPTNYVAIGIFTLQASDQYLERRANQLLMALNENNIADNRDDVLGEFLHLTLMRYFRYVSDASVFQGRLLDITGFSGFKIGVTKTEADIEYVLGLPYAINSNTFVIDIPGGESLRRTFEGGKFDPEKFVQTSFPGSHYETYIWQEMALKDAVSTVVALQYAAAQPNNELQTFTDRNAMLAFINQCTDSPDSGSWSQDKPLAEMVSEFRDSGDREIHNDSLKSFFLGNINYFTSYNSEAEIDAALAQPFNYCYPDYGVNRILNDYLPLDAANELTIGKYPINYKGGWFGPATHILRKDINGEVRSSWFPIGEYSGGFTVPTNTPGDFDSSAAGDDAVTAGDDKLVALTTGSDFDRPPIADILGSSSNLGNFNTAEYIDNVISDAANGTTSSLNTVTSVVNSTRINSAVNQGSGSNIVTAGDPVNMATGNMYHEEVDINIPTRGLPVLFKRTYNSRTPQDGVLGWGWNHSLDQTLKFLDTSGNGQTDNIIWVNGSGAERYISLNTNTTVVDGNLNIPSTGANIPNGFYFNVERPHTASTTATEFVVTEKSGTAYHFENSAGSPGTFAKLVRITDRNNQSITINYNAQGQLHQVSDADNRTLSFAYENSRIKTISLDWANQVHEYFYDAEGHMTAYRNPLDRAKNINTTTYEYYAAEDGLNVHHQMKSFAYANGYKMTFEYYVNGKVFRHYNALGETMTFTFNEFRRESTTVDERGKIKKYIFNEHGMPVETTGPLGDQEIFLYENANDPLLRTTAIDAMGYRTQYEYDSNGNLIKETMPSGSSVNYYHFNQYGNPQLISNALGNYRLIRYDTNGNTTDTISFTEAFSASIDPAAFDPASFIPESLSQEQATGIIAWQRNAYDANGKLILSRRVKDFTNPESGPYTTFDYTDAVNNTEGILPVTIGYFGDINGDGQISTLNGVTEGLGTYTNEYDAQQRMINGFNGAFYPVSYEYDAAGRVVSATSALGGTQSFEHDDSGLVTAQNIVSTINQKIQLTDSSFTTYDKANRAIASADGTGAITTVKYDAKGNMIESVTPDGYKIFFEYDANNRVVKSYDEEGNFVQRKLDLIGRVNELIDPNGNSTLYDYYGPEENGRVQRVTDAENRWTQFEYDAAGQVTRTITNAGRETLSSYDALGRAIRIVSHVYNDQILGTIRPVSTYEYSSLGYQTAIYAGFTNGAAERTADNTQLQERYTYDDFGRLLTTTDAANNTWTNEYDVHGNITRSVDAKGQVTTSTYGYGGVLLSRTKTGVNGAATETVTYQRNGLGQPTQIVSNHVTYDYKYDGAHRLTKVTDTRAGVEVGSVAYDYSVGGFLNSITDHHGNSTNYLYDPTGRLTGIRSPDNQLTSYIYDAGGRLVQKAFPNDVVTAYRYFKDNKVKTIETINSKTDEIIASHTYAYNEAGDMQNATHQLGAQPSLQQLQHQYRYDGMGRLIEDQQTGSQTRNEQFTYDPFGNRRQHTVNGNTEVYSHNNLHQITSIKQGSSSGTTIGSFNYDANGNMTQKIKNGDTTDITYDSLDRIINVAKTGLATEAYQYDHSIRRIQKAVGSDSSSYHYSGPDIIAEYAANDWVKPVATYSHGANMDDPLVRVAANDEGELLAENAQYYHGDALSSIVAMSNPNGSLSASNTYSAFGSITSQTGTTPNYGYTGREPNANGLVYYRARHYDPQLGRFTQLDPKGFIDGINRYVYAINSPVNYVDPWGTTSAKPSVTRDSGGYISNLFSSALNTVSQAYNSVKDNDQLLDYTLRGAQVVGGVGQVLLGGAVCSGVVSCAGGAFIAAKGIDNIVAGIRGEQTQSEKLLVKVTGSEQTGKLINAGLDLGTSVGGLARSVPKINSLGNTAKDLFRRDPANYEAAINQVSNSLLTVEAITSSATIYGAIE